ncbi:MAG: ATP-binding protein [Chloroflexaceae bacterium]|nr:ATP-binding protein [Chloroflexaceae bacterium]
MLAETFVSSVTEAVFGYILEHSGAAVWDRLQHPPEQRAFQAALRNAYTTFAAQHQPYVAALFDEHFLTRTAVPILARCLERDGPPDAVELAALWVIALNVPEAKRAERAAEVTPPAAAFLVALHTELRARDELRELFDSRAFDITAEATVQTAQNTNAMLAFLAEIRDLLRARGTEPSTYIDARHSQGFLNNPQAAVSQEYGSVPPSPAAQPQRTPRTVSNPFTAGPVVSPQHFYGRHRERRDISARIGALSPQGLSLVGVRRSGKSSLLRYIGERTGEFCGEEQHPIVVQIDLQQQRYLSPAGILEGLRRGIARATGSPPWQRDECDALCRDGWPGSLRDSGRRLLVLIDEFERITQRLAEFQDWGEDWRSKSTNSLLTLVIASARPLHEVYQSMGLTSPFGNELTTTFLAALDTADWQQLVQDGFAKAGETVTTTDLAWIDALAGGLPFYVQLAVSMLWQHGDHAPAQAAFEAQATPHCADLWRRLRPDEQRALQHAVGMTGRATPQPALVHRLQEYGLLRADGRPFSSVFAAYIRGSNEPVSQGDVGAMVLGLLPAHATGAAHTRMGTKRSALEAPRSSLAAPTLCSADCLARAAAVPAANWHGCNNRRSTGLVCCDSCRADKLWAGRAVFFVWVVRTAPLCLGV